MAGSTRPGHESDVSSFMGGHHLGSCFIARDSVDQGRVVIVAVVLAGVKRRWLVDQNGRLECERLV